MCLDISQLRNYANVHFKGIDIDLAYVISCQAYFMSLHDDIRYIVAALVKTLVGKPVPGSVLTIKYASYLSGLYD